MNQKERLAYMHRRKADCAKTFALTTAWIQVIGRAIKANKPFSLNDVRAEIASNKIRYGKLDKKWLRAHQPNMAARWIAQGKIAQTDQYVISDQSADPIPLYVGIDNSAAGVSLK